MEDNKIKESINDLNYDKEYERIWGDINKDHSYTYEEYEKKSKEWGEFSNKWHLKNLNMMIIHH